LRSHVETDLISVAAGLVGAGDADPPRGNARAAEPGEKLRGKR
jgi:hypothetical protein